MVSSSSHKTSDSQKGHFSSAPSVGKTATKGEKAVGIAVIALTSRNWIAGGRKNRAGHALLATQAGGSAQAGAAGEAGGAPARVPGSSHTWPFEQYRAIGGLERMIPLY